MTLPRVAMMALWVCVAGAQQPCGAREVVAPVTAETVASICGLDEDFCAVADVGPDQHRRLVEALSAFVKRNRPMLFTYRAIWAEMLERLENVQSSAAQNAFDPCQFVTDDAIGNASAAVQEARRKFEDACRQALDALAMELKESQLAILKLAGANRDLPGPYRYVEMSDSTRDQLRRIMQVHQARLALAQRYPHLRGQVNQDMLAKQMDHCLDEAQQRCVAQFRRKLADTQPAVDLQGGER